MEDLMNEMENIDDSLKQSKFNLNITKREYKFIGNWKQFDNITEINNCKVNEYEVMIVRKIIYLWLSIDENLSWNQQENIVKEKLKDKSYPNQNIFWYTGR